MGLSEERSWDLTPREFAELKKVYEAAKRFEAIPMAQFANKNNRGEHDPAWEPDHFLGLKTYKENIAAKIADLRAFLHKGGARKIR